MTPPMVGSLSDSGYVFNFEEGDNSEQSILAFAAEDMGSALSPMVSLTAVAEPKAATPVDLKDVFAFGFFRLNWSSGKGEMSIKADGPSGLVITVPATAINLKYTPPAGHKGVKVRATATHGGAFSGGATIYTDIVFIELPGQEVDRFLPPFCRSVEFNNLTITADAQFSFLYSALAGVPILRQGVVIPTNTAPMGSENIPGQARIIRIKNGAGPSLVQLVYKCFQF